jgi:PAS domain S-box-containing protein
MTIELRKTGIEAVGDSPWGTHFCHFYETKEDLLDILVPYFKAGLENNEFCMWIVFDPINEEESRNALRRAIPEADQHLAAGDMEIVPYSQWYLIDGVLDLQRVISGWREKLARALARGRVGMRVNGNEAWLTETDWRDFSQYEKELNRLIVNQRILVMCTYPLAVSKASEIFDVARTHHFAIVRRHGAWEVVETPALMQAKEVIKRQNEELEQRVDARTRELSVANSELREEIIQRERAMEAQRKSEERFRRYFELGLIGMAVTSPTKGCIEVNDKICEILGYERRELLLMNWAELTHPDDLAADVTNFERVLNGECDGYTMEKRFIRKDGQIIHGIISVKGLRREDGSVEFFVGLLQDVTEIKHAVESLQKSEAKYRSLFENSLDAIFLTVPDGTIRAANQAACGMFGMTEEELIKAGRAGLIDPTDSRFGPAREKRDHTGKFFGELGYIRKGGSKFVAETSSVILNDGANSFVILRDISERQRAEEALKLSEERLKLALAASGMGVWEWDITTDNVFRSEESIRIMGYPGLNWTIAYFKNMLHPEDASSVIGAIDRAISDKTVYRCEFRIVSSDGAVRWVSDTGRAVYDEDGRPVRMVGTIQDITERKRNEETIIAYQEQLRSMATELSLVEGRERHKIATAIHDQIGQALAMANIKLGGLRQADVSGNLSGPIDEIRETVTNAIQSSRTLTFELSPPILYELSLEKAVCSLAEKYQKEHGIRIDCNYDSQPKPLSDDLRILLFQGVRELLVNAVKHAHPQRITIYCLREGTDIRVVVEDDGVGFPCADGETLTDKFLGFGLFSLRERLKYIGGSIDIKSAPGRGTKITLTASLEG